MQAAVTQSDSDRRDRDFERIFTGGRQINVTHFYSIGDQGREDSEFFAYGYWTHDGVYLTGITRYDGEEFWATDRCTH